MMTQLDLDTLRYSLQTASNTQLADPDAVAWMRAAILELIADLQAARATQPADQLQDERQG